MTKHHVRRLELATVQGRPTTQAESAMLSRSSRSPTPSPRIPAIGIRAL
jgi:hypothetical protein